MITKVRHSTVIMIIGTLKNKKRRMDKVWAKCPEHIGALAKTRTCVDILTYVRWRFHVGAF